MPVTEIMRRNIVTVTPETKTIDAIDIMRANPISILPVVKNDKLVGVVTERFDHAHCERTVEGETAK